MRELNDAGGAVAAAADPETEDANQEECWHAAFEAYQQLIPLCAQKELYATESAIEAIQAFMTALQTLLQNHKQTHTRPGSGAECSDCMIKLQNAADKLAGEARRHLGMKRLPDGLIRADKRFIGSFRGRDAGHLARSKSVRSQ